MLIFRAMVSQDAAAWAALRGAAGAADGQTRPVTPERTAAELAAPGMDPATASLAAFDGEEMVGYVIAEFQPRVVSAVHRCVVHGGVHPGHRRRGLGIRLLREGVGFARRLHEQHHAGLELAIDVNAPENSTGHRAMLEGEGFRPTRRYMEMARPLSGTLPSAADPDGMTVEAWSEETDPEFLAVRNAAFEDHWGSARHSPESWRSRARSENFRPELSYLARDRATGSAAGIAVTHRWPDQDDAEALGEARIQIVGTVREFRKRGVAAALVGRVLGEAAGHGYAKSSLYVDASNPTGAVAVYERAGFEPVRATTLWTLDG